jgi:hypothetical protein
MERNVEDVMKSEDLRNGAMELAGRAVDAARQLVDRGRIVDRTARGGRKAHHLELRAR